MKNTSEEKTVISLDSAKAFSHNIINWYNKHGRKSLPWQENKTPYRVWISEIMLQQTQVKTVIPYYLRFMESFPTVLALANASEDEVLHHWTGLGYYARARNLHKAAKHIRDQYNGEFPTNIEEVVELSGIGRSTAAAILSLSLNKHHAILDGNVKRVLARCYLVEGHNAQSKFEKALWPIAEKLSPKNNIAKYNQAMMDIGSLICTRTKPNCNECPVSTHCLAKASERQAEFPNKKPKKTIPVKSTVMVIAKHGNKLLMIKRPPSGIWGGLWCFPETSSLDNINNVLSSFNLSATKTIPLEQFRHTFSHFHLDIEPVLVECIQNESKEVNETPDQQWYNLAQEELVGFAASTQKLVSLVKQIQR